MSQSQEQRIEIFQDTVQMTKQFERNSETTKHTFQDIRTNKVSYNPSIKVENSDTVSAAVAYSSQGKTCLLNMASYSKAGGGVANGAQAQEECLFRCSNLFETVEQKFYPLKDDECLYTKDAIFFKDKNYGTMDPIEVDVVTVAAINLNKNSYYDNIKKDWVNGIVNKEDNYVELTKNKIRMMLSLAEQNQCDNIILGAWGCGVFKNNPNDMATMFQEVLTNEQYGNIFQNVVFAIINDHNSVGNNFEIFENILDPTTIPTI